MKRDAAISDNPCDAPPRADHAEARRFTVLGVPIVDTRQPVALEMLEQLLAARDGRCRAVYFVNAHTLNLAVETPGFREVLADADIVFNDGTGVRWAARQRGIVLRDNLNGTDMIPALFAATKNRGYRYFLLGTTPESIERAAATARERFAGWELAGYHHGYVQGAASERVVEAINVSGADLLLVGMGNPLQEQWIHRYRSRLTVPLAIGVGGLFDYWAGSLVRAPKWVRRLGSEWVHLMLRQPHKWQRYLLGNPKFLFRITRALKSDLAQMRACEERRGELADRMHADTGAKQTRETSPVGS